jgi:3-oxoacyl-[acyl-carrier protein] reductase
VPSEPKSQLPLAFVTGAARNIGAATARMLARDGFHVVGTDIDVDGLADLHDVENVPGAIETLRMDVRSTEEVEKVAHSLAEKFGRPFDVLINNAGFASVAYLDELSDDHWQEVLNLNLMSQMRVTRAFSPPMRHVRKGNIICLGSIAGHTYGWPGRLAYSSAKAGITGLVRTLAMELAPDNVRVNGIAPAGLHAGPEQVPLGRVGTADDIAAMISLLASEKSAFMTGQMISVDGGMSVAL